MSGDSLLALLQGLDPVFLVSFYKSKAGENSATPAVAAIEEVWTGLGLAKPCLCEEIDANHTPDKACFESGMHFVDPVGW